MFNKSSVNKLSNVVTGFFKLPKITSFSFVHFLKLLKATIPFKFVISNLEEILGDDITKYGFNCYKKGTTVLSCAIQFYDSNESSHCLNKVVLSSSLSTSEK